MAVFFRYCRITRDLTEQTTHIRQCIDYPKAAPSHPNGIMIMRFATPLFLICAGIALAAPPKVIEQLTGKVIGVTDGDTVTLLVNETPIKVRLDGIDAPETKQSYGNESKQALASMVFGKSIVLKKTGTDKYGRTLGVIMLGGSDINARMIVDGWAWHYKAYNDESRLTSFEATAKSAHRGLWADANRPVPPWDYRLGQPTPTVRTTQPTGQFGSYWLNSSSNVRHNSSCKYFNNTNRGRACGPNDGKPCGVCKG